MTYIWPRRLLVPSRPPILVYLDLNHWIALAKAQSRHPDGGQFANALAACKDAVDHGRALFPISDSIYIEIAKIGRYRQRRHLRDVIERVSGFMVVMSRSLVSAHEIEAMLDKAVGPNPNEVNTMNYIDWGVARAFGMMGGFRILSTETGEDVTTVARADHPAGTDDWDRRMFQAELELNRRTIDGPTPEEEPTFREGGWDPSPAFEVANLRARQEIEQVARFDADPAWRKGRIRDVVAAREVMIEINDAISLGLYQRGGLGLETIGDPQILNSMPSFDVAVTIKTEYHRDPRHRWTPNDIHDIDVLGSTLPYCDIVVTDKAVATHAVRTGLAERMQTRVLWRLEDLVPLI